MSASPTTHSTDLLVIGWGLAGLVAAGEAVASGKKVVIECQKHDDYQESMKWLLGAIEEYVGHAKKVGVQGQESGKQLKQVSASFVFPLRG